MKVEYWEPSTRDNRWCDARFSTPEGQKRRERYLNDAHRDIEWRIQHQGYVPTPEIMAEHEKWRARHPELYTNPHK